jgi:hypothetical protein
MMTTSSTIKASNTIKTKEPLHFRAHEMSNLVADKTFGILRGRIRGPSFTRNTMMATLKANATNDATLKKILSKCTLSINVSRNATLEANARFGTRPHVMIQSGAQGTRLGSGGVGAFRSHVTHLSTAKTLCGNVLFPISCRLITGTTTTASVGRFQWGNGNSQLSSLQGLQSFDTGTGVFGECKHHIGSSNVLIGPFLVHQEIGLLQRPKRFTRCFQGDQRSCIGEIGNLDLRTIQCDQMISNMLHSSFDSYIG